MQKVYIIYNLANIYSKNLIKINFLLFYFRLPAFKGFQQQDSHELLRNLLDAIKTEELKRRQTALLEVLRPTKPNTLDDLLKMKIKSNFIIFIIY